MLPLMQKQSVAAAVHSAVGYMRPASVDGFARRGRRESDNLKTRRAGATTNDNDPSNVNKIDGGASGSALDSCSGQRPAGNNIT